MRLDRGSASGGAQVAALGLAVASLVVSGCSTYRSGDDAPPGDCAADAGDAGTYPPCPYGNTLGAVVADATFEGWATSTSTQPSAFSFHDVYDPSGAKGVQLLFVDVSALWCSPCREEATELPAAYADLKSQVSFLTLIFEGSQPGQAATVDDAQVWSQTFSLPLPVAADPTGTSKAYFSGAPPFSMLVDTKTMTIVDRVVGKPADLRSFITNHL